MIEEVDLFGVYMPAALAWAVLSALVTALVRPLLHWAPLQRLVWRQGQLELALFAGLWWTFATLADASFPTDSLRHDHSHRPAALAHQCS
jgi:hypothetical protein